jgi:hypothetical protein
LWSLCWRSSKEETRNYAITGSPKEKRTAPWQSVASDLNYYDLSLLPEKKDKCRRHKVDCRVINNVVLSFRCGEQTRKKTEHRINNIKGRSFSFFSRLNSSSSSRSRGEKLNLG